MKRQTIYFVDENEASRRANERCLRSLIDNESISIVSIDPCRKLSDYTQLLKKPSTAAFILDQRMKAGGNVDYNGTDLASYLRGVDGKVPIYILTSYSDQTEEFAAYQYLVENVLDKHDIEDANSDRAKVIKARLLRHLEVFNDVRDAQEQRYHDLLLKSLREHLSEAEQSEMDKIEGETTAAAIASERGPTAELSIKIAELQKLLDDGQLKL